MEFVINGGFTEIAQIEEILKDENGLMGCMVGRMAMNNTWEIARMDQTFYPELDAEEKMSREEILLAYGDWLQGLQDQDPKLSNTIMVRPIINCFSGEYKGANFRKYIYQ